MTEQQKEELEVQDDQNFADMVESYCVGINEDIRIGDKIQGKIISVGSDSVFIDTGTKIDGLVDRGELEDAEGQFPYKEGDAVELYVTSFEESEIRLSKALSGVSGEEVLRQAFENNIPVEGKVKGPCKGGFHIVVFNKRAFCPVSQMDLTRIESPEQYNGEVLNFLVTRFEQKGKNIVVSRRKLLEKELEQDKLAFLEKLEVGTVMDGRITSVVPYGVFVEVFPTVEGLVHVSELSWARVDKPEELFKIGETVRVKLISVETQADGHLKMSFSIKQSLPSPWESIDQEIHTGDKIRGKVTRCAAFGAFVEIKPGVEGLVHISEMSYTRRVLKPEEVVKKGDTVDVVVKELDMSQKRISLSLRDAEGDPWAVVSEKYREGQTVDGVLEKKEKFGYFVGLEPGITGLLPISKITRMAKSAPAGKLREGDTFPVIIDQIQPEKRRITLSPADSETEEHWERFASGPEKSIGTLGEKLKQALDIYKK